MAATTTARGYGHIHQQRRKQWAIKIKLGNVVCRRCLRLIPADPATERCPHCHKYNCGFDLGHAPDRTLPPEPEHRCCNRGATAAVREARRAWGTRTRAQVEQELVVVSMTTQTPGAGVKRLTARHLTPRVRFFPPRALRRAICRVLEHRLRVVRPARRAFATVEDASEYRPLVRNGAETLARRDLA